VFTAQIAFGGQDDYTHIRLSNQALLELNRWMEANK
jgi:hypothetical protein